MKSISKVAWLVKQDYRGQSDWDVEVTRGWSPEPSSALGELATQLIVEWVSVLDRLVPNELDYMILFSSQGASASVNLENSYTSGCQAPFPIKLDSHATKHLANFNWEPLLRKMRQVTEAMEPTIGENSGPIPQWFKDYVKNGGAP